MELAQKKKLREKILFRIVCMAVLGFLVVAAAVHKVICGIRKVMS